MTAEEAEIARNVRRELGKRPVDSTQVDVQVKAGNITLAGRIAHLRDDKEVNLQAEVEVVYKMMMRDRHVKGFFDQMRYVVDETATEGKKETDSRGRMRS